MRRRSLHPSVAATPAHAILPSLQHHQLQQRDPRVMMLHHPPSASRIAYDDAGIFTLPHGDAAISLTEPTLATESTTGTKKTLSGKFVVRLSGRKPDGEEQPLPPGGLSAAGRTYRSSDREVVLGLTSPSPVMRYDIEADSDDEIKFSPRRRSLPAAQPACASNALGALPWRIGGSETSQLRLSSSGSFCCGSTEREVLTQDLWFLAVDCRGRTERPLPLRKRERPVEIDDTEAPSDASVASLDVVKRHCHTRETSASEAAFC